MVARKTVYCKSFSHCKTQRAYLFEAQLHILSPDYFKLLKDTLRYKVVSQGTLQVTEVDNA